MSLSYRKVFSFPILYSSKQDILSEILKRIQEYKSFTIFTPNPEILVKAWKNKEFAQILQKNDLNIPDGFGITLFTGIPTIKGRVLMEDILKLLNDEKKSVYILGAKSSTNDKTIKKIKENYPQLSVYGLSGPVVDQKGIPIDEDQINIQKSIEKDLEQNPPTVVFVGFGAPKQEYWVNNMKNKFPNISWMVVGGTLDTYSGEKQLPPQWMETLQLEWLFRLIQEPQRISRIINAIIIFPMLFLFSQLGRKK